MLKLNYIFTTGNIIWLCRLIYSLGSWTA